MDGVVAAIDARLAELRTEQERLKQARHLLSGAQLNPAKSQPQQGATRRKSGQPRQRGATSAEALAYLRDNGPTHSGVLQRACGLGNVSQVMAGLGSQVERAGKDGKAIIWRLAESGSVDAPSLGTLAALGPKPLTVGQVAAAVHGQEEGVEAELQQLVASGRAYEVDGRYSARGGSQ